LPLNRHPPQRLSADSGGKPILCRCTGVGLDPYRAQDFAKAEEYWRVRVTHPMIIGPSPPLVMAERAAEYREHPPSADWDGVFVKTTK